MERGTQLSLIIHDLIVIINCMNTVPAQYVYDCRRMEEACEGWARELVCRCMFRAWQRATATSRREGWERERRAKMHHTRSVTSLCTKYILYMYIYMCVVHVDNVMFMSGSLHSFFPPCCTSAKVGLSNCLSICLSALQCT